MSLEGSPKLLTSGEISEVLNRYKLDERRPVHAFHRYFGKLIPAIPAFAIEQWTKEGDLVLDPFCGSGTTIVEATYRNRRALGCDLNPLATFISGVKSTPLEQHELLLNLETVMTAWEAAASNLSDLQDPYVVNMNHWFRPEVKRDLLLLLKSIETLRDPQCRNFFLGVFSAFLRGVSNADPQHVFPGYSKRMRALDAAGRKIDVRASFLRAARKRIAQISDLPSPEWPARLFTGRVVDAVIEDESVDLVVTNPPYISSIRYLETMKIEMGFLGMLKSQADYLALDKTMTGSERYYKRDLVDIPRSGWDQIDLQVETLTKSNLKMAKTVSEYFQQMITAFQVLARVIRPDGRLVIKIMDSKVRDQLIPTPSYFCQICESLGFDLEADIIDEFDPSSRSLLTARNTYSGLMTYDHILVLRKKP